MYYQCHVHLFKYSCTGGSGQYYLPPPPVSPEVYEQYRELQMVVMGPQPLPQPDPQPQSQFNARQRDVSKDYVCTLGPIDEQSSPPTKHASRNITSETVWLSGTVLVQYRLLSSKCTQTRGYLQARVTDP